MQLRLCMWTRVAECCERPQRDALGSMQAGQAVVVQVSGEESDSRPGCLRAQQLIPQAGLQVDAAVLVLGREDAKKRPRIASSRPALHS